MQKKEYEKSISIGYTYVAARSDDKETKLRYERYVNAYDRQGEMERLQLQLERPKPWLEFYKSAIVNFDGKNYTHSIVSMENSINEYIKAEDECRYNCELSRYDERFFPDLQGHVLSKLQFTDVSGDTARNIFLNILDWYFHVTDCNLRCVSEMGELAYYGAKYSPKKLDVNPYTHLYKTYVIRNLSKFCSATSMELNYQRPS